MKMSRLFLSLVLLTAPLAAFAQDASNDARFADLRASMTAEEFKAAGLDKLSDAELSALSAWLTRKVGAETARAVEQVRQETQTAVAQAQATLAQVQRVGDQEPQAQAHGHQSPAEQALPPDRSALVTVVDVVFVQRFVVVVVAGHRGCDNGNSGESSAAAEGAPGPLPLRSAGVATECR